MPSTLFSYYSYVISAPLSGSAVPDPSPVSSSLVWAATSTITSESGSESLVALSTEDILVGIVMALVLASTASFLQGRREQDDIVLWENKSSSDDLNVTAAVRVFDGDSWKEMAKPENYVLYNRKVKDLNKKKKIKNDGGGLERPWVLLKLLALFVPIFSVEFFFALSRQLLCDSGTTLLVGPDSAEFFCSPSDLMHPQ